MHGFQPITLSKNTTELQRFRKGAMLMVIYRSVRKNTDLGLSTAKTAFLFWNGAEVARSCAAPIFAPMGGVQWI